MRDQIGLYSKVRETRAKTEYIREFLVNRFGDSKVQFVDYLDLKHKLQGDCIVERLDHRE